MQSRSTEVDGIQMRWEESGAEDPVVFVHGIPTSPRLWRHVAPRVEGARSLEWEMVGYGGSIAEGADRDISVGRQAEYLATWMRQTGLGEGAVICGHDLGGGVAQILAVRHPELVRGLVLTNSICYDSWPIAGVRALRAAGPLAERMPPEMFRRVYRAFLGLGHDDRGMFEESVAEHLPFYERADGAAAMVRQARSLDSADTMAVADGLQRLDVPARIVWGTADKFQPIGYGYRLAYELGATLERVEGGKHFTPEDHPEPIARAVRSVLEET